MSLNRMRPNCISRGSPRQQTRDFDFLSFDTKDENHLQLFFLLTREGWAKSSVTEHHEQKQAISRFFAGASILSEPVRTAIRRELKRVSPDVRIYVEQIRDVILAEVMKREVVEGDKFAQAEKALNRAATKALKARKPRGRSYCGCNASCGCCDRQSAADGRKYHRVTKVRHAPFRPPLLLNPDPLCLARNQTI